MKSLLDIEDMVNAARRLAEQLALMGTGVATSNRRHGDAIMEAADHLDGKLIKIGRAVEKLRNAADRRAAKQASIR